MYKGPTTILEAFERNLEAFPDRQALNAVSYRSGEWERLTWQGVKDMVDRLAGGLYDLGIRKGQKLAFMNASYLENCCFYLAARKVVLPNASTAVPSPGLASTVSSKLSTM